MPVGLTADLMRVAPAPGSAWVALRACTTVLTGQIAIAALGRQDLAVYVAFGAFAAAYGGSARSSARWRVQLRLGALLTLAVVSGALVATTGQQPFLMVAVASGWAVFASALSQRQRWQPPGPLFLVFASATSAAMPTSAADVLSATATTGAAAALAVVLGVVEVRVVGSADGLPPARQTAAVVDWRLSFACGLATVAAGAIATASGLVHPSWAMVAAMAPLSVTPLVRQLVRGVHRITGTVAGLALAALILAAGPLPTVLLIAVVTGLHAATDLTVARHYGLALLFITPLALLLTQLADPLPAPQLLVSRIVETAVGVLIGLGMAVLARPRAMVRT